MRTDYMTSDAHAVRGVGDDRPKVRGVAQALVMGLGGTGIQTISRVRTLVEGSLPEQALSSALTYLGVDSVSIRNQVPPLPPGVGLPPSDLFNLVEGTFNPAALVRSESSYKSPLMDWWDFDKKPPNTHLSHGMKQDRMLGRLAYYRSGDRLAERITQAFVRTASLNADRLAEGSGGQGASRPSVYLVASMCGGTGSSGVLEALYRIWAAADSLNTTPDIKLFLYMPGIFEGPVARQSPNPSAEIDNLRANAYGFLRELDHFITHSSQLASLVAAPTDLGRPTITDGDLVSQVFLIDRQTTHQQFLTEITDAYEAVSSVIYQLLMTEGGQEIATNGVNMDQLLQETDGYGKRRVYCGLGLACITYPGETLRRHLTFRFADWLLRDRLLVRTPQEPELARKHPSTDSLIQSLQGLHNQAQQFEREERVRSYAALCTSAAETLAADNTEETIGRVLSAAESGRPGAIQALTDQYTVYRTGALSEVDDVAVAQVFDSGGSLPFGTEMLKRATRILGQWRDEARATLAMHNDAIRRGTDEVEDARRTLEGAAGWRAWFGRRDSNAAALGDAIAAYGKSSLEAVRADSSVAFYTAAIEQLDRLRRELEEAEQILQEMSHGYSREWHADELVGKDAGPRLLTVLIPGDVYPEVEDATLANEAFKRMLKEIESINTSNLLRDLYADWRGENGGRAAFDLGSRSTDLHNRSEERLRWVVERLAAEHALQVGLQTEDSAGISTAQDLYLPRSLSDASQRVDGGESLERALTSLSGLAGSVLLPIANERMRSSIDPSPSTRVARPASLSELVEKYLPTRDGRNVADWPDEERIQAITTLWGASAHALAAVPSWRDAYESALAPNAVGVGRLPHLNRNWNNKLDPLTPEYRDRDLAAECITRALSVAQLIEDSAVAEHIFGSNPRGTENRVPLHFEDHGDRGAWRATTFLQRRNTELWEPRTEGFDFGTSLEDLLTNVADNAKFQQFNETFCSAVVQASGRDALLAAVREIRSYFAGLEGHGSIPAETKAAQLLRQVADDQIAELERINATSTS